MVAGIPLHIPHPDGRLPLAFNWDVSSFSGWGSYGLNLALTRARHPRYIALSILSFGTNSVALDALRNRQLDAVAEASRDLWRSLAVMPGRWFPDRFVVFSGGKLELTRGQDLVLAAFRAFRAFHRRHPKALLLTAWHSPWPGLATEATAHPDIVSRRLPLAPAALRR